MAAHGVREGADQVIGLVAGADVTCESHGLAQFLAGCELGFELWRWQLAILLVSRIDLIAKRCC